MDELVGAPCVVTWHRTLTWAAEELGKMGKEQLSHLKVHAGEHLAAILTTSFLGEAPSEIDAEGGVDLIFRLSSIPSARSLQSLGSTAAFEVKSLPGPFREVNAEIDRTVKRGNEARGLGVTVLAREAKDIVKEAQPWIDDAQKQLFLKTTGIKNCSKNVFLVIHPCDHLAVDSFRGPPLGPLLPKLTDLHELDSVWLLWVPHVLTVWSKAEQGWIDLMFNGMNADEHLPNDLTPLQAAELRFLELSGDKGGSPYFFGFFTESSG